MERFIVRPRRSLERPVDLSSANVLETFRDAGAGVRVFADAPEATIPASEIHSLEAYLHAVGRRRTLVVEGDRRAFERFRQNASPDVFVEEEILFEKSVELPFDLLRAGPLDYARMLREQPLDEAFAGGGRRLEISVFGRTRSLVPLPHAEVHVFLASRGEVRHHLQRRTDAEGRLTIEFAEFLQVLGLIAYPYSEYWPVVQRGDPGGRSLRVVCDRLPDKGPSDWWHDAVGSSAHARVGAVAEGCRPVRVGVIDSGCGPHPALAHVVDKGAFINGVDSPDGRDSGSHGTHVCGIVGARGGGNGLPFWGVAPGVELYSVRVFPPDRSANQGDIADAIDVLVDEAEVDLINMSLGSAQPSAVLRDAIRAAERRGTVCICAAGNSGGPIEYPAAFAECLAVAALGKLGEVEANALPALPTDAELFGASGYYAADFTCFGEDLALAAPGVGIVASVPARFGLDAPYAAMNGTSMAAPAASAAAAALLAGNADYASMAPGRERSRFVKTLVAATARTASLPASHEGRGIPQIDPRRPA